MKVFGIIGWKNSGKTTLICRLIAYLKQQGLSVSTIKHTHHDVELDQKGKDSYQHRLAGASEVMLVSRNRWALFNEISDQEPELESLLIILLIEGFKQHNHPKIQVYRAEMGTKLLVGEVPQVVALASDCEVPPTSVPHLDLNDITAIGDFIIAHSIEPAP